VVANNFLGTTADGLSALSNFSGISIGGDGNQIGGLQSLARNLVSGNLGAGIYLNNASGNLILGNEIGVARDGTTPLPNTGNGIEIVGGSITNTLGSPAPGAANLIANNGEVGIRVVATILGTPAQNSLRGNRIFNNGDLGIDLGGDGPDINDPGDGDTGENERQNYPVLLSATDSGTITGTLNSMPNTEYILDFYRNTDCDPAGYGEGEAFLGMGVVMTDNAGDAAFVVNVPSINLSVGDSVTATASDPDGNTSEFSACISVSASNPPTPTSTPSPGPSPTSTWTATAGASPTPTGTVTPTWTSTPGPSQTLTYTATAEPSPAPTLTGTPGPAPTGTPVPSDYPIYLPIVIR
jgi:parallel beta-helix repeat protein